MSADTSFSEEETLPVQTVSQPRIVTQKRTIGSVILQVVQAALILGLACASYFVISHYFVQSVKVVGVSMVPTLADSQSYLLNRWVYYFHPPKRTDVVVLRDPSDNGFSVKRVIGVSGDHIHITNGAVFVNGQKIEEPYLRPNTPTFPTSPAEKDQLIVCGQNQFFVLGDNRLNSVDSRVYGPVPRQNILGMIVR